MARKAMVIRPPRSDEYDGWAALFRAYRAFYRLEPDEAVVERVWSWIHAPEHETAALVAVLGEDTLAGLAHYRRFARPSTGSVGLYLDDLVTDPAHRGAGVGRALLSVLAEIAAHEGCTIVRWITANDNTTAQRVYDAMAIKTSWVPYELPCR